MPSFRTDDEFKQFIRSTYFPNANTQQINAIAAAYPSDPAAGSPFDTGSSNNLTTQFKRIAAFQGDLLFQAPRRSLFSQRATHQPIYSYRTCLRNLSLPHIC